MRESLVIQTIRDYKQRLADLEAESMYTLANEWLLIQDSLSGSIDSLVAEAMRLEDLGQHLTRESLNELIHYKRLLAQVARELNGYSKFVDSRVSDYQYQFGELGVEGAIAAINASFLENGVLTASFDVLPVEAIEAMVGLTGSGSPLKTLLMESYPEAVLGLSDALIDGIAKGLNPLNVAYNMMDAADITLERAVRIARTEDLRCYREINRQQMIASGVVTAYRRICGLSKNTCLACLAADGTLYDLETEFEEHVCGRCSLVPVVKGMPDKLWQTGAEWFNEQDPETQRDMMGSARFDAWQSGQFTLNDLVTRVPNDTWGTSLKVTPLRDLQTNG